MLPTVLAHCHAVRQRGSSPSRPPLERDHANDQQEEDQQEGQVETRERRRVPDREGRERGGAGHHQPDLVAVPDGSDRLEHRLAVPLVSPQERKQGADPEVEALEQEVAGPEDRDQDEPELREAHVGAPTRTSGGSMRA